MVTGYGEALIQTNSRTVGTDFLHTKKLICTLHGFFHKMHNEIASSHYCGIERNFLNSVEKICFDNLGKF